VGTNVADEYNALRLVAFCFPEALIYIFKLLVHNIETRTTS